MRMLIVALALISLLAPRPAAALDVAIELEPGVGLPLSSFPDGVPVTLEDADGSILGTPNSIYNFLVDAKTSPGFNFGVSLMLDNFIVRGAFSYHKLTEVSTSRYAIVRVDGVDTPELVHNLYLFEIEPVSGDVDDPPAVITARVAFGYRWYFAEGKLRPYLPLGVGAAMVALDGDAYWGMSAFIGLGLEYRVTRSIDIGIRAQYEWMGIAIPENFQASAAQASIGAAASSGNSVLEAFLESLHTLQLGATTTFRF